ncbi:MAG: gliding motility-associated C-terminal domain-containing protein [Saprospiraceae bacterium]|nr:gliding motility-associated C-terminal domain-containing protein [Saprospiraceae bacterium]
MHVQKGKFKTKAIFTVLVTVWIGFAFSIYAQNLVPNPDFESYDNCPSNIGGGFLHCIPWENGNNGTSDYFNACDVTGFVDVPSNVFGDQLAHSGDGYAGFFVRSQTTDYFEYIQAPLIQPLEGGVTYHVSFYISLSDELCGSKHVGAYFSEQPPPFTSTDRIDVVPQIDYVIDSFLSDKTEWMFISGCFTAEGDEGYITIGNFHLATETLLDPDCSPSSIYSYYFIDDVVVEEGPDPGVIPIDLGGPVSACNAYIIEAAVDSVGYMWEDGSSADTLMVSTSGIYNVTITDGCNIGIDSIDITINGSAAPVDIGTDSVTLCSGDHFDISLDPNWQYVWSTGALTPDISLAASGTFYVTMDDGCNISSDSIVIIVLPPPAPFSLGLDTVLCPGTMISFNLNPQWGDFLWQDGNTASMSVADTSGIYAVTVSNICGSYTDEIIISPIVTPAVELGGAELSLCTGNAWLINLDTINANFLWQDGSMDSTYLISNEGLYIVTVSNQCGSDSDSLIVDEIMIPSVDLGQDITLCSAQFPYQLDVSGSPEATDYIWQDGSTNPVYDAVSPGQYIVTVSNSCFSSADTLDLQLTNGIPQVVLPVDFTICTGDSVILTNAGTDGTYQWNDLSTDTTYLVLTGGTYSLTVTNDCGSGADTVYVDMMAPPPIPDLGTDTSLCQGQSLLLSLSIPDVMYVWQDLSMTDTFLITMPGMYWVQINNLCGTSTDTILVALSADVPPFYLGADTVICAGDMLTLTTHIPNVNYLWQDGSTLSSFDVQSAGTYFVTAFNLCNAQSDTIIVSSKAPPSPFDLGNDTTLCAGTEIILFAPLTNDIISWQDGSSLPQMIADAAKTYSLLMQNECGSQSDSITVSFDQRQPVLDLEDQVPWCQGDSITLDVTQLFDALYAWSTGVQASSIMVTQAGIYSVTVSTPCSTVSQQVEFYPDQGCAESEIYFPNIFSPNNDNINDLFYLVTNSTTDILSNEVSIFDRWGNMVFNSTQVPFEWNGSFRNKQIPAGVYAYTIHVTYSINGAIKGEYFRGDVTLIR